jgi:two-component system CitB family response regulator
MIRVLVVEDDFRVAQVHVAFTGQVAGFTVVGTAGTAAQAREHIAEHRPHLLLLDIYLPDESGLDLLRDTEADAIVLTAASDAGSVRRALRRGALNYLVKPFTAEQLAERLGAYARYRGYLGRDRQLSQEDIDRSVRLLHDGDRHAAPKGQSPVTIRLVADALRDTSAPCSAAEIAGQLGIARATAQRYLAALAQDGVVDMNLRYGSTGRPEHLYTWIGPRGASRPARTE